MRTLVLFSVLLTACSYDYGKLRGVPDGSSNSGGTSGGGGQAGSGTGGIAMGKACPGGGATCASGFCSDGVCCKTACDGPCLTCAAAGSVGTCIPADIGTNPRSGCTDMGKASCGTDGFCDGSGSCENYAAGVTCQDPGCTGSTLTYAGRCDGLGTCVTSASQSCLPWTCGSTGMCKTTCSADADCTSGNFCVSGSCGLKAPGASCGAATDCKSGICAEGVCCATVCTGNCKSCDVAGSAGTCINVPAGQDPLAQCAPSSSSMCGTDGFCDGAGKCRLAVSGTVCTTGTCTGGTETLAGRCDGVGGCAAGTTESCAPYVCGASGDCLTICATNADCATGYSCSGTICCNAANCALKPLGASCAATIECASGFCQQGVCCASACTGTCQSCALGGISLGTCTNVPIGQAPNPTTQCTTTTASTCGTNGLCDGTGKCQLYKTTTTCAAATCTGDTLTPTRTCDGAGNCKTVTSTLCDPFACGTNAACKTTCTANTDCTAPTTCNTTTGSCGKLSLGAACTMAPSCASGFCVNSVCCNNACLGTCTSCNLSGTLGICTSIPGGQKPNPTSQCTDTGAATCGTNGFCDGSGACQKYASGTGCAAATCSGSTDTPAASCNGAGACVTPASFSCLPYTCGTDGQCKTI